MKHDEAIALLDQRLPATVALEVLESLDPTQVELGCVEGFRRTDDDKYEARLDLIVDFWGMRQFTTAEHIKIAELFIRNRMTDRTFFEVWSV